MFNEMVSYNAWCMKRCLPDGVTTPVPEPTTPKTNADCCNKLKLKLHGDTAANVGYLEGTYDFAGTVNGRDYWTKDTGGQVFALWYSIMNGWIMFYDSSLGGSGGSVFGPNVDCPTDQADGWRHYDGSAIVESGTDIQWECLGISNFFILISYL